MSMRLHCTKMNCEIKVNPTEYPQIEIEGAYIMEDAFGIGKDIGVLEKKINNTIVRFFAQRELGENMESIKPDLVLPLKREWFARIWNGAKRTEYREVKPYWTRRIGEWVGDGRPHFIEFRLGYGKYGPRMLVQTSCVDIGPCPYPEWRGDYYRIDFDIVQPYIVADGYIFPLEDMPKMKERKGAKK